MTGALDAAAADKISRLYLYDCPAAAKKFGPLAASPGSLASEVMKDIREGGIPSILVEVNTRTKAMAMAYSRKESSAESSERVLKKSLLFAGLPQDAEAAAHDASEKQAARFIRAAEAKHSRAPSTNDERFDCATPAPGDAAMLIRELGLQFVRKSQNLRLGAPAAPGAAVPK